MAFRFFIILLFTALQLKAQEKEITILDYQTKEVVPYVGVNFLNGYGMYSDVSGKFRVPLSVDEIELSHISYSNLRTKVNGLGDTLFITQKITVLEDVVVSPHKPSKKSRYFKPGKTNETQPAAAFGTYGFELALFIPPTDSLQQGFLEKIELPVYVRTNDRKEKAANVLLKVNFYSNAGQYPGELLSSDEQLFILSEKKLKKNIFEMVFERNLLIPGNGLYVVVTLIGKTDADGNLKPEYPYTESTFDGKKIKLVKTVPYYIPLEAGTIKTAYSRSLFGDGKWSPVQPPVSRPREFYYLTEKEKEVYIEKEKLRAEKFDIPFGYLVTIYTYE